MKTAPPVHLCPADLAKSKNLRLEGEVMSSDKPHKPPEFAAGSSWHRKKGTDFMRSNQIHECLRRLNKNAHPSHMSHASLREPRRWTGEVGVVLKQPEVAATTPQQSG